MWKALAAVVNRFVTQAYEEADAERRASVPVAGLDSAPPSHPAAAMTNAPELANREFLESQFQRAFQLMQSGNPSAARQLIRAAAARIAHEQPGSALFGEACIREATILTAIGELPKAEIACRAAIALPAVDDVARKERINHKTFLGDILARQEKLEEAELDEMMGPKLPASERRALNGVM